MDFVDGDIRFIVSDDCWEAITHVCDAASLYMRELSLFILLVTPSTKILPTLLFQYNEKGWNQYANAINLIIIVIVVTFNLLVNKLTGASIDKGIGSGNN